MHQHFVRLVTGLNPDRVTGDRYLPPTSNGELGPISSIPSPIRELFYSLKKNHCQPLTLITKDRAGAKHDLRAQLI